MTKKTVALLFGGVSSEHEVSCMSVSSVYENVDREKYDTLLFGITKEGRWFLYDGAIEKVRKDQWESDVEHCRKAFLCPDRDVHGAMVLKDGTWEICPIDVVFPVLHGKNGEDGTMQGLLEIAGIPYVGCHVLSSAVCMDKDVCHAILKAAGVPQVQWLTYTEETPFEEAYEEVAETLGYPVFVKPANAGSSVGITMVKDADGLEAAFELAFQNDKKIVVEAAVKDPIEVECSVLGNRDPIAGFLGEVVPADEFYSYDAKYFNGESKLYIPARLSEEKTGEIREMAKRAYQVLGCSGMTRVDFLVERATGKVVLNEPNTLPGFTDISMYPKLLMAAGMTYSAIIDRLLELALEE